MCGNRSVTVADQLRVTPGSASKIADRDLSPIAGTGAFPGGRGQMFPSPRGDSCGSHRVQW